MERLNYLRYQKVIVYYVIDMSKITIKDVARRSGVSIATVSRVVNQNYYVSPEIQKKVLQAIIGSPSSAVRCRSAQEASVSKDIKGR